MNRFSHEKKKSSARSRIFQLFLFILFLLAAVQSISSISGTTTQAQTDSLRKMLTQSSVHCYATEGAYPESLLYLKEHYGVSWDENRYFVDYQPLGSNLMPVITVICRTKKEVPQ